MLQRIRTLIWAVSLAVMILGLSTTLTYAQTGATSANISGVITDEQGGVIGNANVIVKNLNTNITSNLTTGEDGTYSVRGLPPGLYEISVKSEGFKPKMGRIELDLGTDTKVKFALEIGDAGGEVVEVTANSLVNQEKTESSTNIVDNTIRDLPINRRNFLDFSLTSARVTVDRTPTQGVTSSSGLSFNAQSGRRNNVTIDGLDNNDTFGGAVRSTFSQDAVQEFQVVSDSYSAEFGRAVGGVVNIVTKGGSNNYNGSLFFFDRNDKTSARDVFVPFKPPYSQYQFGATIGGPVKKDKIFFFSSFERLTISQNNFVTLSNDTVAAANRVGFNNVKNGAVPFGLGTTSVLARIDAQLTPNDRLYLRYNFGGNTNGQFEPFGGLIAGDSGTLERLQDNAVALNNTLVRGNLINETRFIYNHRDQSADSRGMDGPAVVLLAPEGQVRFGTAPTSPFKRDENLFQIVNNVSILKGRQQIKFGADFAYRRNPTSVAGLFRSGFSVFVPLDFAAITGVPGFPFFTGLQAFDPTTRTPAQRAFLGALAAQAPNMFPGFPANVPLADLSLPVFFQQGFGSFDSKLSSKAFSGYVEDTIKLRPNLLVKAGLRYDINRSTAIPDNNGNFAPRVSFAYSPTRLPKLHVTGAYGIFFAGPFSGLGGPLSYFNPKVNVQVPEFLFPYSILAFAQPSHHFPIIDNQPGALPPGAQVPPQFTLVFDIQKNLRNNYSQQATASLSYLVGANTVVGMSYNYVRGLKLLSERNINPVVRPQSNPALGKLVGRVDPTKGDITFYAGDGDSYYNSITFQVERRFSNHFSLLAHYTFAKAIDDFFDVRIDLTDPPVDPLNIRGERGLSSQDIRNRFVFSGVWDLNYTKNPFLTGFKLSTIINANSGVPYNLLAGADLNNNGDNPPGDRPLVNGGSISRNAGILPGFTSVDMRLVREVRIKERVRIEGIVEAFNLFNHTNISEVDRVFSPDPRGNFNLPTQENGRFIAPPSRYRNASSPRQIQLGFRLSF